MTPEAITSYELLIYSLLDTFPVIHSSTLRLIRTGPASGRVVGDLTFSYNIRLNVAELVDFDAGRFEILQYGYVAWQNAERLYWYDSQAHPNDSALASTHPHHKHIHPNIKHNRIPAPGLSFTKPNLPFLIDEIAELMSAGEYS